MSLKSIFKRRLAEIKGSGFPTAIKAALLQEIDKQAAESLEKIVRDVVTPAALASLYAHGDMTKPVKKRKESKQVIQEGGSPFGQHVTGPEPETVTGSAFPPQLPK